MRFSGEAEEAPTRFSSFFAPSPPRRRVSDSRSFSVSRSSSAAASARTASHASSASAARSSASAAASSASRSRRANAFSASSSARCSSRRVSNSSRAAAPPALSRRPSSSASSAAMSFFLSATIVSLSRFVSTRNVSVSSLASCVFLRTSRASAFFNASSARVSRSRVSRALCFFLSSAMYVADWSASSPVLRAISRAARRSFDKETTCVSRRVTFDANSARSDSDAASRAETSSRDASSFSFSFFFADGSLASFSRAARFRLSSSRSRLASSRSRASVSTFSDIASSAALASSAAAAETATSERRERIVAAASSASSLAKAGPPFFSEKSLFSSSATDGTAFGDAPRGSAFRGGSRSGSGRAVPLVRRDGPDATGASVSGSGTSRGGSPRAADASSTADDEGWISDALVVSEGSSSRIEASYEGGGCSGGAGEGGLKFSSHDIPASPPEPFPPAFAIARSWRARTPRFRREAK